MFIHLNMAAELYVTWNMYFMDINKYIDGEIKSGRLDEKYTEEFANIALDASKIFGSRLNFKKSNSAHMYKLIIAQLAEAVIEKLPEAILNNAIPPKSAINGELPRNCSRFGQFTTIWLPHVCNYIQMFIKKYIVVIRFIGYFRYAVF